MAYNVTDAIFGAPKPDTDASSGWNIGQQGGQLSAQAGPAAFALDVIKAKQAEDARKAALAQEQQKARQAKLQQMVIDSYMIKNQLAQKYATTGGVMSPEDLRAANNVNGFLEMAEKNPLFQQAIGGDPSKLTSGSSIYNFAQGGVNTGGQEDVFSKLRDLQKNLPEGVSTKAGGFTVTGSKIGEAQKKEIGDIAGTASTIDRVILQSEKVPDLGGIKTGKFDILGMLPRGLEGRAREMTSKYITAGEGGGVSGLTREQDENLRTYISNLDTNGGSVYKALSGDSGRLSDLDLERGKNLMWRPDLGESVGLREKKNKVLKEAVKKREEAIRQGKYYIHPETGAIMTPEIFDDAIREVSGVGGSSDGVLERLGLDPQKYEIVEDE